MCGHLLFTKYTHSRFFFCNLARSVQFAVSSHKKKGVAAVVVFFGSLHMPTTNGIYFIFLSLAPDSSFSQLYLMDHQARRLNTEQVGYFQDGMLW